MGVLHSDGPHGQDALEVRIERVHEQNQSSVRKGQLILGRQLSVYYLSMYRVVIFHI